MTAKANPSPESDREIVISRVLDAPRELVFAAFMDPHRLERWWGPRGFTIETKSADIREGGMWRFTMHGPDGTDWPNRIRYTRIIANERIELQHDSDIADDPHEFRNSITFEDAGGKTRVTMKMTCATAEHRAFVVGFGAIELGGQTLEKLGEHVAKTSFTPIPDQPTAMRIRRIFDAPRDLVWLAVTRPEHFVKWWGPHGSKVVECEIDLRPGGSWRAVIETAEGHRAGFRGEYREVVPLEKIVQTFVFDGVPTEHSLETMTLTAVGDQTVLEVHAAHTSKENLAAMIASGMERGARQTYDRLEDHLALLSKPLEFTRTFDAPLALVYKAWTDPAMFARWFAPHGFDTLDVIVDPRVGGSIRFTHVFKGMRVRVAGWFLEVDPERRLVFDMTFVDDEGRPVAPDMMPDWPPGSKLVIVAVFRENAGKTTLTVHQTTTGPRVPAIADNARGAAEGWKQTFERLRALVQGT